MATTPPRFHETLLSPTYRDILRFFVAPQAPEVAQSNSATSVSPDMITRFQDKMKVFTINLYLPPASYNGINKSWKPRTPMTSTRLDAFAQSLDTLPLSPGDLVHHRDRQGFGFSTNQPHSGDESHELVQMRWSELDGSFWPGRTDRTSSAAVEGEPHFYSYLRDYHVDRCLAAASFCLALRPIRMTLTKCPATGPLSERKSDLRWHLENGSKVERVFGHIEIKRDAVLGSSIDSALLGEDADTSGARAANSRVGFSSMLNTASPFVKALVQASSTFPL
jgi:hypothetical protein